MVNVFSFHISWNPFISGDSIKEMASGFGFFFLFVLGMGFGFCLVLCICVFFFNLLLWLCTYSGRILSWREKKQLFEKKLTLKAS